MIVEYVETKEILSILWKMWKKPNVYPTEPQRIYSGTPGYLCLLLVR